MAAPTATARVTPTGFRLEDGHGTFITFASDANINFFEISTGAPGVDGGDEINTTTHHNTEWRTFAARQLKTLTPFQVTAAYDPECIDAIIALINLEDDITVTFSDGSTLAFYGFLKSAEFSQAVDGEMPTVTLTIVPTNYDPDNCVEAAPVLVSVGTC